MGMQYVPVVDHRAVDALRDADAVVAALRHRIDGLVVGEPPPMGLSAGERPTADVEVLCSAVAAVEFELARRMHEAVAAGCLPLAGDGSIPRARGWSAPWARRLARAGAFASAHPRLGEVWAAGMVTSDHVDALARHADRLTAEEMTAVVAELDPLWGQLSPTAVVQFVQRVIRMLHPPPDPDRDECDALESRALSFALTADSVLLSGSLPRLEGELVIAAIDAMAERLRTEADHVPTSARRADALVALVNAAHSAGALPTRGGLPVSVTVTVDTTALGDQAWTTSRGHVLTGAERRFAACDAMVTPVLVGPGACPPPVGPSGPGERIAALAATLLAQRIPLAVGRSARTATPAQRRALAVRDGGCVIPGCGIPAEACQTHHVVPWAAGGRTDLSGLVLLCWAHHRQVDLGMWAIAPAESPDRHPLPQAGSGPGVPWPAGNGAPWTITRTPRSRWRL